ncbi:MAG: cell division protein FtsZ [Bacteroidales bacterium]|nr:cell division protein FtsZ [Bacteroidales bacterium]
MLKFDSPKNQSSIIKVIGVGGGGSNAVNHMYNQGIEGVDFIVCNTDSQALYASPIPTKIQLGTKLTEGRGAGSVPEKGKDAAVENNEDIKTLLENNTKMLFVTAGMGGGTGTGAAPVIAEIAKEMDILTVGIVTIPFSFEGRKRKQQAENGIKELRQHVDTLLIICNDKLRELYGDLPLSEAFSKADNILTVAAKGIAEIITVAGYINVDFEDVKTVMNNSGVAIMGSGIAEGENRAEKAIEAALSSPLLNDDNIEGANNILLYLSSGSEEISMDEVTEITEYIQNQAGLNAEIIWGNGNDESLGNNISITLIATGFESNKVEQSKIAKVSKVMHELNDKNIPDIKEKTIEQLPEIKKVETKEEEIKILAEDQVKNNIESEANSTQEKKKIVFDLTQTYESKVEENIQSPPIKSDSAPIEHTEEPEPKQQEQETVVNKILNDTQIDTEKSSIEKKSKERIKKLRDLSVKLKTPAGLAELENEPAYVRKNVSLEDNIPSSESEISRFSLSESENGETEIKSNNSFLHDNVD